MKITDGADGRDAFTIAEAKVTFDEIYALYEDHIALDKKLAGDLSTVVTDEDLSYSPAADKPFTIPLNFKCTDSYGGIVLKGRLKVTADLNGGDWVFYDRSPEYWKLKRPQHWTTYPITPISTGIVRQKFKNLATQYDKQEVIHPSVWGFCMRYQVHMLIV